MLEPTELGKLYVNELNDLGYFGKNYGRNANDFLRDCGFQLKHEPSGDWVPQVDLLNKGFVTNRHPWNKNGKSGYNCKWNKAWFSEVLSVKLKKCNN